MKSSFFRNLRLQTYIQVVNTIIPLITTPYIARVLGASMIGSFSSAQSIASFFTLFAMMGTNNYGTRCISSERDLQKKKIIFLEIYALQLITCMISTICYMIYCFVYANDKTMAYLQFITMIGCFVEVSWFFYGIEDFKATVMSSMIFRVCSVVLLLSFVKSSKHLWIYTIIMLGSALGSQLVLWFIMLTKGYLKIQQVRVENIKKHIRPNIKLFVPLIAMTICTSTDKAMLGVLSSYEQAGYYSNIDRIINVPFSIFSGIGTVFLPRMSSVISESKEQARTFFFDTLSGIVMLGVAISFGIMAVSDVFIPLFLGNGYESCVFLINVFSPIIIIKCISNAIRVHYLIPFHLERIYIKSTCIGAVLNIYLNYILIPGYGALGAIIATFASEILILIVQIKLSYKFCELKNIIKDLVAYLFMGALMIMILNTLKNCFNVPIVEVMIEIFLGAIVYCSLVMLYWMLSHNALFENSVKPRVTLLISKIMKPRD